MKLTIAVTAITTGGILATVEIADGQRDHERAGRLCSGGASLCGMGTDRARFIYGLRTADEDSKPPHVPVS
ncbi:MAG: hypothetical protein ACLFNI_09375 [Natronomonas sp.]